MRHIAFSSWSSQFNMQSHQHDLILVVIGPGEMSGLLANALAFKHASSHAG